MLFHIYLFPFTISITGNTSRSFLFFIFFTSFPSLPSFLLDTDTTLIRGLEIICYLQLLMSFQGGSRKNIYAQFSSSFSLPRAHSLESYPPYMLSTLSISRTLRCGTCLRAINSTTPTPTNNTQAGHGQILSN